MADTLGPYRLVRRLGEGGMATAFLAVAPSGQQVVLKVPLEPTPDMTIKLRDEAQAGFRVKSPFVVETLDFFIDRGRPVLVIAYIEGCALRDLRVRGGRPNPLPAAAVAWIGRAISEALASIHEVTDGAGRPLGMLHRDVTASNILIDRTGTPRLIDLGIARSIENQQDKTQAGMLKGTLRFIAPELLLGDGYSPATDLWSLGVSLFEAAVGRQMVGGEPVDIFRALTSGAHKNLRPGERVEPALKDALDALLADKGARLRNARAAARMFAAVEQRLVAADPAGRSGQAWLAGEVPHAQPNEDDVDAHLPPLVGAGFDDEALGTLVVPRAPASAARPAPPRADRVVIGDTRDGSAPTLQLPAWDARSAPPPSPPARPSAASVKPGLSSAGAAMAPTLQLPAVDIPAPAAGAPTVQLPAVNIRPPPASPTASVAPTIQMAAVHPQGAPPTPDAAAPTMQMAAVGPSPGEAGADPTLVMAASSVSVRNTAAPGSVRLSLDVGAPKAAPGDVLPSGTPTLVMPTWVPHAATMAAAPVVPPETPRPSAPASSEARPTTQLPISAVPAHPLPTLDIPIVVIDEES